MSHEEMLDQLADSADVALVGMAIRFPGASTVEDYWRNLAAGVESITFLAPEPSPAAALVEGPSEPLRVRAGGILDDIEGFDADFFGFSRREAEITDPQVRLLLECSWEALESAGCAPGKTSAAVAVFVGASMGTYLFSNVYPREDIRRAVGHSRLMMGNHPNFLSTWISYKLDLRGPSMAVQTACSTSLVAVHLGWQSLLNGECDVALCGASSISIPQAASYIYREGGIHSPDGRCRAFDAAAQGTVGGNGVAVLVLKRLRDAVADGNPIHAVLKGSAVNNDGSLKIGYTAPSVDGQAAVVVEALAISGCHPDSISYLEAHGTGTPLGDPIEIAALTQAYRTKTQRRGYCALGSVKPNIGHLDTVAGAASLVKVALALRHRQLPPLLHFTAPNPKCHFEDSPFRPNAGLAEWPADGGPRRAGVSSLGIGGTNAHVIVEEPPPLPASGASREHQLLLVSAKSEAALTAACERLAADLEAQPERPLADVAFTLQRGRSDFKHRASLVATDAREAAAILRGEAGRLELSAQETSQRPIAFLFPGQGTQHLGMGRELYASESTFRAAADECCRLLAPHLDIDLRALLFTAEPAAGDAERLTATAVAQPALVVVEIALARLWQSWGIEPTALVGHSVGELAAAHLAGVMSLADTLRLVAARGRLMGGLAAGAMLAVSTDEASAQAWLAEPFALAAVNAPERLVIAGPREELSRLGERLAAAGTPSKLLQTAHAFHSPAVEPILAAFRAELATVRLEAPRLPWVSSLTGRWIEAEAATDPEYWCRQLRHTVRYGDAVRTLLAEPARVLLEVGPGQALAQLALLQLAPGEARPVLTSLPRPGTAASELAQLLASLGRLWGAGLQPDWGAFWQGERRRFCELPTYPFQRQRYWIEPPAATADAATTAASAPSSPAAAGSAGEAGPTTVSAAVVPSPAPERADRRPALLARLGGVVQQLTGAEAGSVDPRASFFELGVDSLLLIQASQLIEREMGLAVPFRALFEELSTLDALAAFLDRELPPEAFRPPAEVAAAAGLDAPAVLPAGEPVAATTALERIVAQQLAAMQELMARQLATVQGVAMPGAPAVGAAAVAVPAPAPAGPAAAAPVGRAEPVIPVASVEIGPAEALSPAQSQHLAELTAAYHARTGRSRAHTERYRPFLADNRNSVGFRPAWKELVYPLVAARSRGSRVWDLDGHEYVDLAMGFGINLLGHQPPFVEAAVRQQLERGLQLGPQSDLAGEVAERLCRLVGAERAIFSNSGTEAVMIALRLARTVRGRSRVALFEGSYHGFYDGTLGRRMASPNVPPSPLVAGITPGAVADLSILDYGSDEALAAIEAQADELAAVLVEPVQSRRPSLQPREFLHRLREITRRRGICLIFDEMVTGFRCHQGGAQAWFGVQADLLTYGKALGGGLPVGVIAGRGEYMDAIDGGVWQFGDASYPTARQTLFAGTFCKHPLAMAAARAVLEHLESEGPALQERLNRRTGALAGELNAWLTTAGLPLTVEHFGSLFVLRPTTTWRYADLLRCHLALAGVYAWEGATRYLSTAHSDADIELVLAAYQRALTGLCRGGFLAAEPPTAGRRQGAAPEPLASGPRAAEPLTTVQRQLWVLTRLGPDVSRAYNESVTLHLRGRLDVPAMARSLARVLARHPAFRTTFDEAEPLQRVLPTARLELRLIDLGGLPATRREAVAGELVQHEVERPFDLARGPLLRPLFLRLAREQHQLVLVSHHLVTDARSFSVLLGELRQLYAGLLRNEAVDLPAVLTLGSYLASRLPPSERELAAAEVYWLDRFRAGVPVLDLPTDRPRPAVQSHNVRRHRLTLPPDLADGLRQLASRQGATLFSTLLAGLGLLLHQLARAPRLTIGVNTTEPLSGTGGALVGLHLDPLAILLEIDPAQGFERLLREARQHVLDAYQHHAYPASELLHKLGVQRDPGRFPLTSAVLNLGRDSAPFRLADLEVDVEGNVSGAKVDLYFEVAEAADGLRVALDYASDLYTPERIDLWLHHWQRLLAAVVADPTAPLASLPAPPPAALAPPAPDHDNTADDATGNDATAVEARLQALYERSNLTRYQLALWAGQQLQPALPLFLSSALVRIPFAADEDRLVAAWGHLEAAADALRTVIEEVDGVPQRRLLAEGPGLRRVDLSGAPEPRRALRSWVSEHIARPFDLRRGLTEAVLLRTADDELWFFLNQHHLMSDGYSTVFLWQLVAHLYDDLAAGKPVALTVPSYQSFVDWQREELASERGQKARGYWLAKTARPLPPLAPFGRHLPAERSTRTARLHFRLPPELAARLHDFVDSHQTRGASRAATVLQVVGATLAALLARLGGARTVALGTPFKNRTERAFKQLPGLLMHILPLHLEVGPTASLAGLAASFGRELRAARPHQSYPLTNALDQRTYEVELNYVNFEFSPLAGVPVSAEHIDTGHSNELIVFEIDEFGERGDFQLFCDFNREAFTASERELTVDLFLTLLAAGLAAPERPLWELPHLPPALTHALLVEANDTAVALPLDQPFSALFAAQVARTPERQAVGGVGPARTYAELAAAAARIAAELRAAGAQPGEVVALLQHRGADLLAAILGVFAVRAAYLPLDPASPPARLANLVAASGARLVIAERELAAQVAPPPAGAWRVLTVEALLAAADGDGSTARGLPQDLAYVIYTSGSTGTPKGAMVEQRGMVNHLLAKVRDLELGPGDAVLQNASQTFDISVWQFLAPLLVGGRVEVVDDETAREPARLLAAIEQRRITIVELVPSFFRAVIDEAAGARLAPLRTLVATGEALPPELAREWLRRWPDKPLVNAYGPTECSDDVTHAFLKLPPEGALRVPLGRAILNTRLYVVDAGQRLLPPEVPGELLVGGAGVGRGYLRRPGTTARVFVPDALGATPGGRLYRTGDLVRCLPDGQLELLGRLDFQAKVRGHRVEPGEVEAALGELPGVREAVVVVRQEEHSAALAAYVVAVNEAVTPEALRDALHARLPAYLVPSTFTLLADLPRTANGKVDRQALPAPAASSSSAAGEAPQGADEELLAAIWAEVLQQPRVGRDDDYFALGGDSLLAIQIASRASREGLKLAPMDLFRQRTVAALAAHARTGGRQTTAEQGRLQGPLTLTPIIRWLLELALPNRHHWNQAVLLTVPAGIDAAALRAAVARLVEHHDALRARLHGWGEHARGEIAAQETAAIASEHDLRDLAAGGWEAELAAQASALQASLHLEDGPLLRVALFRLGRPDGDRLFVVIHHLVVDAVSWRILLEDLQSLLFPPAGSAGELPAKTTSFQRWGAALARWAGSQDLEREGAFWQQMLADLAPLPADRHAAGPGSAALDLELDGETTRALLRAAAEELRLELPAVLLAALAQALAAWSGRRVAHVVLEGHGREEVFAEVDLSRTVGWFTTLAPVRLDVPPDGNLAAAARGAAATLASLPHRGLGYGVLRYLGRPDGPRRQLAASAEPEVRVNYLGQWDASLPASGPFRLARESTGPTAAPGGRPLFALDLNLWVQGGQLRGVWSYDAGRFDRATIAGALAQFVAGLRQLATGGAAAAPPAAAAASGLDLAALADLDLSADRIADVLSVLQDQAGTDGAEP